MNILELLKEDLHAAKNQDPAATSLFEVALAYSGVHALWSHRLAHAMWQRPHLRGTALNKTKRHPTIGNHVMLGSGAEVLGPVTVGDHSAIGANAVVVRDVPPHSVAVGLPAVSRSKNPGTILDPREDFIDPALLT